MVWLLWEIKTHSSVSCSPKNGGMQTEWTYWWERQSRDFHTYVHWLSLYDQLKQKWWRLEYFQGKYQNPVCYAIYTQTKPHSIAWKFHGINCGALQYGITEWMCLQNTPKMPHTKLSRKHNNYAQTTIKASSVLWYFQLLRKSHGLAVIVCTTQYIITNCMTSSQCNMKWSNLPNNY